MPVDYSLASDRQLVGNFLYDIHNDVERERIADEMLRRGVNPEHLMFDYAAWVQEMLNKYARKETKP